MFRLLRGVLKLVVVLVALLALILTGLWLTNPDPRSSNGWARLADMPVDRGESAGVAANGKLYVVGGLRGFTTTSGDVSVYDIERDRWTNGPSVRAHHHGAATILSGGPVFSGGARSATDWRPYEQLVSIDGDELHDLPAMPEGRQGHAIVQIDSTLLVIGGAGGSDRTLVFSEQQRWSNGAPLPVGRDHLRAVAWQGKMWVLGGRSGDPMRRVDIYDPVNDRWSRGPDLPEPMSAMAVGVLSDGLHVVGGEDPNAITGGVSDDHFVLAEGSRKWERGPRPLLPVHGAAYGVHDDKLYIAGGASRQGALSTISWTPVTQVYEV